MCVYISDQKMAERKKFPVHKLNIEFYWGHHMTSSANRTIERVLPLKLPQQIKKQAQQKKDITASHSQAIPTSQYSTKCENIMIQSTLHPKMQTNFKLVPNSPYGGLKPVISSRICCSVYGLKNFVIPFLLTLHALCNYSCHQQEADKTGANILPERAAWLMSQVRGGEYPVGPRCRIWANMLFHSVLRGNEG